MDAFVSTRGAGPVPFREALFRGLAPDGGLFVPAQLPRFALTDPEPGGTLADHALWASLPFLSDSIDPDELHRIAHEALDFPAPLVDIGDGVHVLELFHGPTLAFKDVGARYMARCMEALGPAERTRTILVATSGDTGGAVAAAFHGMSGYRVVALFPSEGVSERQRRQMSTLGDNIEAIAVNGSFDDCQRMAKAAFADPDLADRCALTSANSINIGRLLPQTFYYVHAAARLGWAREDVTFVVPSGNLGNLCAGLLAHAAGMPARGFLAATNRNRCFVDFLESGHCTDRPSRPTVSNAMDVGSPSNLERIRWLYTNDLSRLRRDVRARSVSDDETLECISRVHARTGYTLDPHTAVGFSALEVSRDDRTGPCVLLATAHPAKFPDVVRRATGVVPEMPDALAERLARPEYLHTMQTTPRALRDHLLQEGSP